MEKLFITHFQDKINSFYNAHKRSFPWRYVNDPYLIVVSEIMLQQTQTFRVQPKYIDFIKKFPSFKVLAQATHHDLFMYWQGLGYNRRALYVHQIAQWVIENCNGRLPQDPNILQKLKGIGPSTASSICAFAFNMPTIFIETNIRTVFLHEFFNGQTNISDKQIIPLIEQTLYKKDPRSWYYALMDYGVFLKAIMPNPSRRSAHHTKQSAFEGSTRQLRGAILKLLLGAKHSEENVINIMTTNYSHATKKTVTHIIQKMVTEKIITYNHGLYSI